MKKALVIVESPAKVKTIKKFLSKDYAVEASMGHIRDLPKSQLGIDVDADFEPKYITIRGKSEITNRLKKEAKNAELVYLATDPDREGEAISWHLSKLLNLDESKIRRVEFNEITKSAVTNAIKHPRKLDLDLIDAQQGRRVLDRLVGYKISPLLWKKVKKGLSAGRVQSVVVRLICDRENEIRAFQTKEYWSLIAMLTDNNNNKKVFDGKFYGSLNEKLEINDEKTMNQIVKKIEKASFKVDKMKKGEKKRNNPFAFTTSTLQQDAYKKLGFTTKKTMMLAQQLYEGIDIKGEGTVGLVSYIRTDSVRISEEAKGEAEKYITDRFGKEYVSGIVRAQKSGKKIQDAHEAIRPSSVYREPQKLKDSLQKDQYRLYELIWERFAASQMSAAVYDTVNADIIAKGKESFLFKAAGSLLKFPGFLKIYQDAKEDKEEFSDVSMPELEEGQELNLKNLEPKQHFTEPPARFTEATLVKTLEEKGIGRPSTYSPIISTIQDRNYVVKDKKMFIPTELGEKVTDLMKEYFASIVNVEFTAEMEKTLDEVAEGDVEWKEIIRNFYGPFEEALEVAEQVIGKIEIKDEVSEVVCDKCGKYMVFKQGKFGKFLACPGFPDCRNTKAIVDKLDIQCPKCETGELIGRKTKKGKKFFGCNRYPDCDFVSWDEPIKEKCPKCGSLLYKKFVKGNEAVKCNKEGCGYVGEKIEKEQ